MDLILPRWIRRVLNGLAVLLIVKVLVVTLWSYHGYLPPDFQVAFLQGREGYFWDGYHWAFYLHIFSGPLSLVLGMFLLSQRCRERFPRWHRKAGRVQVLNVLLLVAPSGLGMAWHAAFGPVAGWGFALLAIATAITVALGWYAAVDHRFDDHRRWMVRCFVLLCSAVVVRVNGGIGQLAGIESDGYYIQVAWTSWLVPIIVLEVGQRMISRKMRSLAEERTIC